MGPQRGIRDPDEDAQAASPDGPVPAEESTAGGSGGPLTSDPGPRQLLTPPVLLTPVARYPSEGYQVALDRGMLTPRLRIEAAEGRVLLKVLVRADGSVGAVEVAEGSGSRLLDDAAVRAAGGWVFAPATRDGQPIEAWALVPIRFIVP